MNIVTIQNINMVEYTTLMALLHDIYAKDISPVDINNPANTAEIEKLMIFFSNQYSYITELWARMVHEVRLLKRTSKNKDEIELAMDKRDLLEKIQASLKIKYQTSRTMLYHHDEEK
jgi:hypothetical protein